MLFCNLILKILRSNRNHHCFGFRLMSGGMACVDEFWPQKSLNEHYQYVEVWKKATTSWKLLPAQFSAAESRNRTSNTVITVSLCPTISPHMGRDPKQRSLRFVLNIFKILLQKSISPNESGELGSVCTNYGCSKKSHQSRLIEKIQ